MKVLLTGGGTGGHILPLAAVYKKLKQLTLEKGMDLEARYYGPESSFNSYLEFEGIVVKKILGVKFRRYWTPLNFLDLIKAPLSILESFFKVLSFGPDVAFSKGGSGALFILFACWVCRVPIIIHESDTMPGLTNRLSSFFAKKIELGWESAKKYFPNKNVQVVGVPLREYSVTVKKNTSEKPLILILGGSQGSQRINNFIFKNLESLLIKFQILHQVGPANYQDWPKEAREGYKAVASFENSELMGKAYSEADLIISRSGSAIFEIALFGKPSILIPLAESANDHQKVNAYEYAKSGTAFVIEEKNLTIEKLLSEIERIFNDKNICNKMSEAAKLFSKPNATEIVARDILNL